MKIHQSRRNSCVPKSLLHMKDVLTVFQQMCGRAVPECMYGNDGVKTCLSQCVLKYCTYISRIDALRCDSPSMGLKDKVVTGVPLPECPQMRFSRLGTTAHALSMNVLDMVNLVKGNYDGKVKRVPSSPFTFPR